MRARVVIAADGLAGGLASRALGGAVVSRHGRLGAAAVADGFPAALDPDAISMAIGRAGYVGLVRQQDGRTNLAAALDPAAVRREGGIASAVEHVLRECRLPADVVALADRPWAATPTLTRRPRAVAGHRLLAVGDAGGYVEPFTGEGIGWALAGGLAVASLAVAAGRQWSAALEADWTATHVRLVGRRQRLCRILAFMLRRPLPTRAAIAVAAGLPTLASPLIVRLNQL